VLPRVASGAAHVWHQYVVRAPQGRAQRDELRANLREQGIGTLIHYPVPVHQQPAYARFATGALPHTEAAVGEILSLPLYPELTSEQASQVAATIRQLNNL
jgi:dTDP-4-amino-4,6-dideoxygalactose transaminase